MFPSLFKKQPVLDPVVVEWLYVAFAWALRNIGRQEFFEKTELIEPSNRFFPGRESSETGMAALIFQQVKTHAQLEHWPCQLVNRYEYDEQQWPVVSIHDALQSIGTADVKPLVMLYEPLQARNPEVMIANYVYALAYHLAELAQDPLPCDDDQWPCMLELIGVYLGFGVMFVNTAAPRRGGGCGSCRSPLMERQGQLSEDEVTYALAIFCALKNIPAKQVTPFIKNYQRAFFKKALQEVLSDQQRFQMLHSVKALPAQRGYLLTN